MDQDYTVFVHATDETNKRWGQQDTQPQSGEYPTSQWRVGEIVEDRYELRIAADGPAAGYHLSLGLYDWQTGERLPAVVLEGERLGDDQITVATLTVRRPGTHPAAWGARALAGLILVSALVAAWRSDTDE